MVLDPIGLGARSEPQLVTWDKTSCLVYALGVGAGTSELAFTTENTRGVPQRMLPTMPVTLGLDTSVFREIGGIDWSKVVHADQGFELLGTIPVDGQAQATTKIVELWDKGKAAVIVTETEAEDVPTGEALFRTRSSLFVRGAGGWGGERGPSAGDVVHDREPDTTITYRTREDQALLYRLSGDRNPLHSDPSFAQRAGFDRPILHGLCTFGFTGRAVLNGPANGDPDALSSMSARFASPVYPGDILTVDVWVDGSSVEFETRRDDGTLVLSHGAATVSFLPGIRG